MLPIEMPGRGQREDPGRCKSAAPDASQKAQSKRKLEECEEEELPGNKQTRELAEQFGRQAKKYAAEQAGRKRRQSRD